MAAEGDSSDMRIVDEYDWTDLFEEEKMEMEREEREKRKREEAAEEDSSNMKIDDKYDWLYLFEKEREEREKRKREEADEEEAAEEDLSKKRLQCFYFFNNDEYNWMDPVEAEKLEIEIEEIEERQREKADVEVFYERSSERLNFRFEISEMEEFIQQKRERRSKTNFQTSVVQLVKHQEIGLKKPCTNSLRKFLLNHEEDVKYMKKM